MSAQNPKLAPQNLETTEALLDKGDFSAQVALEVKENKYDRYRFDGYRDVERIVKQGGVAYERLKGGSWVRTKKSADAAAISDETVHELDEIADLIRGPFSKAEHHDKSQGETVWRFVSTEMDKNYQLFTYERSREKPKKDGAYPMYTFVKNNEDVDGKLLLQSFSAQFRQDSRLIPVTIDFHWNGPQDLLFDAKKSIDGQPCKVNAIITGDKNMKVRGVVRGQDFDLTIQTPETEFRQIESGGAFWSSEDSGKTWNSAKEADLRYYHLVNGPIHFSEDETIPPFQALETTQEGTETVTHIRFKSSIPEDYPGDRANYWISGSDRSPMIRRFLGPISFEHDFVRDSVEYIGLAATESVLPPPGNPEAVPKKGPGDLLFNALRCMDKNGPIEVNARLTFKKTSLIHGIVSHEDFDLTQECEDGSGPMHQIAIREKSWGSFNRGKTWKKERSDDRLIYNMIYAPIVPNRLEPDFEIIASEQHDGETWIHIAEIVAEKVTSEDQRPHYWIQLKDGEPLYVRRYEGSVLIQGQIVKCSANYAPAQIAAVVKPPTGE